MKMKVLFMILSLFLMNYEGAQAQTTTILFEEDFEDIASWGPNDIWILLDLDGDERQWFIADVGLPENGFTGIAVASISIDLETAEPLTPDNLLISPVVALPAIATSDKLELSFKVGGYDEEHYKEFYSVYAVRESDFAGAMYLSDVIALLSAPLLSTTVDSPNATTKTLALDNFAGDDIRLVFRHHNSTDIYVIIIDDVKVEHFATAGINKELAVQFTLFPNPTTAILNFANSSNIMVSRIQINDLNGRTVQTIDLPVAASESTIDVSQLQAGVYFLNFTTNEGSFTKKIIKK